MRPGPAAGPLLEVTVLKEFDGDAFREANCVIRVRLASAQDTRHSRVCQRNRGIGEDKTKIELGTS